MINLIKYEFIRKWRAFGIFLAIALSLNLFVLYELRTQFNPEYQIGSLAIFFGGMLTAFFVFFLIDITVMYSQDLNQKTGYMFLMTPNSGYKLLGAKVLTGILEGFLFLLIYAVLVAINFFGIFGDSFHQFLNNDFLIMINSHLANKGVSLISLVTTSLITAFISVVSLMLTIFAALSIRKSILAEKKFGGFISLIIFLTLGWLNSFIVDSIYHLLFGLRILTDGALYYPNFITYMIIQFVFGISLFILSGYLLEKKMDI